jgi:hypothetical protein
MSRNMDWRRAHKLPATESKYGLGALLPNGATTAKPPLDSLGARADREMRRWLRRLSPKDRLLLDGGRAK